MPTPPPFAASVKVMWLIHIAFINAVPIYAFLYHFFLRPMAPEQPFPNPGMFVALFAGISAVQIALALTIDRWAKIYGRQYAFPPEDTADGYLSRAIFKVIITDAMFEAIAIYGLIGVFIGMKPWQTYLFMGVALLALLLRIPHLREVTDTYYQLKSNE